jgi:serine phosphatase RsbU (regulator of sigma subunit)
MYRICILLLVCFAGSLTGQETRADWLRKLKTAPEDTAKTTLYGKLAVGYVGVNFDSAWYYAQTGLALAKKLEDPSAIARLYNTNSSVCFGMGQFAPGKAYADSALAIALEENDEKVLGNAYLNVGHYYRTEQQPDSAIHFYKLSLDLKIRQKDSVGMGAAYNSIGFCTYSKGDISGALDYYYKSVEIREALNDKKGLANAYLNIAFVHLDRHDTKPALDALGKSHQLFTELGIPQSVANVCNAYGIAFVNDSNYVPARRYYEESLSIRTQLGDSAGMAECYTNIGNIYNLQHMHDSAFMYYRKTIAFLDMVSADHAVSFLANYATSAAQIGKLDSAQWAIMYAKSITSQNAQPDLRISLYGALATYYEAIGKLDSALYYSTSYYQLRDSVYRSESTKALGEMETKYQTTKKQKAIDDLTALQKQKDLQLLSLSVGAGLLVLLAGFVIYGSIQRKKTNRLLEKQNHEISVKNKDITDSITYARRIQQSVLPDERILFDNVGDAFIHYQPRDIVSGDFYWFRKEGSRLYVACADCTGHGVPGALVSVIGVNLLGQIIDSEKNISTGHLLDQLHRRMFVALNKDSEARGSKDGMDIAVICIDKQTKQVEFSGASRSILRVSSSGAEQIKGNRFSIGGVHEVHETDMFTTAVLPLMSGDAYYLFTDGFADQFGGPQNKKFMSRQLSDLLYAHSRLPMNEQQQKLEETFRQWKGMHEQVDDVLIIGMRIG